jgi:antitoxin (DNA-binding transcriptional repressor) of toxin-antitoxin stability system
MRVAGIREIRARTAELLGGGEPLLVTRHGKLSGLYLPLEDTSRLPPDLHRELGRVLAAHLARKLTQGGVTERQVLRAFDAFRRRRR